jgi:protein NRD1
MPDYELRRIFDKFGTVQTCIVNKDKRHAFVKMVCRDDAVRAKEAMEKNRTPDSQLRVSAVNIHLSNSSGML